MFPRSVSGVAAAPYPDPAADVPLPQDDTRALRGRDGALAARLVAPLHAVAATPSDPLTLAGLGACVDEARVAALKPLNGPPDPTVFAALRARVEAARARLPPEYQRTVADPLLRTLDHLGARGFARLLARDPERVGEARLLLDVAQAVLQHGEGYQAGATDAFQEVVSDLYDGFLSAEDRRSVKPPDRGVTPPLVLWGSADAGPYTWPVTATGSLDVGAAVVSLPAANASGGLLAWPALAHETAGHDILEADDGLREELARAVHGRLVSEKMGSALADYFSERIDETAADVLGVLNMGPAAAVGLVGYFRALNGAWGGTPSLRTVGSADDPHPADIVRAYIAAETVRLLSFDGAAQWADRLVAEADRDLARIRLGNVAVTPAVAKAAAAAVARAIVQTRLGALEGRALRDIQDWRNEDEAAVARLRAGMASDDPKAVPAAYAKGAYAAHAVAAGVYEALGGAADPSRVMARMIALLDDMHGRNPGWKVPVGPPASASAPASGARVA